MPISTAELRKRARRVKLLLMDVDGVLTDGRIYYVPDGRGGLVETKGFHPRDGLGLRYVREAGLKTGVISGRGGPAVKHRMKELRIDYVYLNTLEKLAPYQAMLRAARLSDEEICYVGDDLVDLPILIRAGLAVGIGDGHPLLRRYVHYWTKNQGGRGAVREVIELILSSQEKFEPILKYYLRKS